MENKLRKWQKRLSVADDAYKKFSSAFDDRERLVKGENRIEPCCEGDVTHKAYHVRNIAAELIESQVDTAIPMPKVTPRHKEDEPLAKIIEDMLIDELDRMPMEVINDMAERTVPIQGGCFYLFEWDNSERTQSTIGDITAQYLHPKQVIPQEGVYTSVEDMDYIFLKLPQTKKYIEERYGVDMSSEGEEEPEIRSADGESESNSLVTQYIAFYRNKKGGIGKYSWVNDIELEDLEDYQARRLRKCKKCGALEPLDSVPLKKPSEDGKHPDGDRAGMGYDLDDDTDIDDKPVSNGKKQKCPYCGSTVFEESQEDFETIWNPKISTMGVMIPGAERVSVRTMDELGNPIEEIVEKPTVIPYYRPDIYPVILQKSVSCFGQLLGDSDIDKIRSQQNSANRYAAKLFDMTLKAGSFATLPSDATVSTDNEDMKIVRLESAAEKQMIDVFDMQPSGDAITALYNLYSGVYEEARQAIGITDSYQGRRDSTATSGKAKEFAAQQSAGRLESKRVMKEAAYQQIFEAIFKFKLAYVDEPRSIIAHDETGGTKYETFDRYDFLKRDEAGQWYWNDQFLFSCDSSTPLARDKESLWQETRMNFQQGCYGDPSQFDTLILFWSKMEEYHYPGASDTKKYLQKKQEEQQAMMIQQQAMQQQQQQMALEQQAMVENEKRDEQAAKAAEKILDKAVNGNGGEETETKSPDKPR